MSELLHRSPAAVIFDMDGLLLDTEVLYRDAILSACSELGYVMHPETHRSMIGVPTDRVNEILLESFGPNFPLVRYYEHCSVYVDARCQEAVPTKPGALGLLEALKVRGIPTAVATSTSRKTATHHLKSTGLLDLLETVVTRDDVEHRKPHPETYLRAAERFGVDPADLLGFGGFLQGGKECSRRRHGDGHGTRSARAHRGDCEPLRGCPVEPEQRKGSS
jgi:beta-phosphoglucomutase-like phosphatase (HAD superfamily)